MCPNILPALVAHHTPNLLIVKANFKTLSRINTDLTTYVLSIIKHAKTEPSFVSEKCSLRFGSRTPLRTAAKRDTIIPSSPAVDFFNSLNLPCFIRRYNVLVASHAVVIKAYAC
jgi:hypothetical protein